MSRYIHLNPVRAKIVSFPNQYPWSSFNEYIGKQKDNIIDKELIDNLMDASSNNYKAFVEDGIEETTNPFKDVYAGFILGSTRFIKDK